MTLRETGSRLRESKIGSAIRREGRLGIDQRGEPVHKKKAGEGGVV